MIRAATDVGRTFTDLVYLATDPDTGAQEIGTAKVDTTPPDYERGVMSVIAKSGLPLDRISVMSHGTTVVIDALTERKGVKTGLTSRVRTPVTSTGPGRSTAGSRDRPTTSRSSGPTARWRPIPS
jgi:N-methylhydantoinase A/oxoprolinase/acetone carboxylase beta subunit